MSLLVANILTNIEAIWVSQYSYEHRGLKNFSDRGYKKLLSAKLNKLILLIKLMKYYVISAVFFIFLINSAGAFAEMNYQVFDDKVLVEASFDSVRDFEFRISSDAKAIEVNSGYEIIDFGNYKLIKVLSANELKIKYITESHVDKSGGKYYFTARNFLAQAQDINLFLPEGAVLDDSDNALLFPSDAWIGSDGRRIVISWNDFTDEQIVVTYEFARSSNSPYLIYIIISAFIITAVYFALKAIRKFKSGKPASAKTRRKAISLASRKRELTRNLFGEEKKIIEYLFDKKGKQCWTKEIARDLGISKVRLSRRLRNLEQNGLLSKTPYGNENRIKLLPNIK